MCNEQISVILLGDVKTFFLINFEIVNQLLCDCMLQLDSKIDRNKKIKTGGNHVGVILPMQQLLVSNVQNKILVF